MKNSRRMLVIDDEVGIHRLMRRLFSPMGFVVDAAASGEEGLARIAEGPPPDVLLLDVNLPGLDGLDVLRQLREKGNQVPVYIVTARNPHDIKQHCGNLGVAAIVQKPFSTQDLKQQILGTLAS